MFESKGSKERRREGVRSYNSEGVFTVSATPKAGSASGRRLRVAGYTRVFADDVVYNELQKKEIPEKIKEDPGWTYVGLYFDEGVSCTGTEKRPAFDMMIEDCMAGKIDLIYTKSISRFARNLRECSDYVDMLKKHDPPVGVYFEAGHFGTLDPVSAMSIVVLGLAAEVKSKVWRCLRKAWERVRGKAPLGCTEERVRCAHRTACVQCLHRRACLKCKRENVDHV